RRLFHAADLERSVVSAHPGARRVDQDHHARRADVHRRIHDQLERRARRPFGGNAAGGPALYFQLPPSHSRDHRGSGQMILTSTASPANAELPSMTETEAGAARRIALRIDNVSKSFGTVEVLKGI